RALPVWLGAGVVGTVIFGGTGMHPHELTQLAIHSPLAGITLGLVWLLLFVPVARLLVRDDATRYLRTLPHEPWAPRALALAALIALQLPWLALWLDGEHLLGAAIVLGLSPVICGLALIRTKPPRTGARHWRGPVSALLGIALRALSRRAGDALLRAAGLALLAGAAAGLFVRNNDVSGAGAGVIASCVIAIVLVPGWAATLLPLAEAHRSSAWLAASTGITEPQRRAVLALAIAIVYVATTFVASLAAGVVLLASSAGTLSTATLSATTPSGTAFGSTASILGIAVAMSIGLSLCATRGVLWAQRETEAAASRDASDDRPVAARVVVGAIVATALAIILLGSFGAPGVAALVVIGLFAMGNA
ncbi:MAG TPA: hypothetical protein VGC41_11370, partial [Kofleriaceae bacterium]